MSYQSFIKLIPLLFVLLFTGCSKHGPKDFPSRDNVEKKTKLVVVAIDGFEPVLVNTYLKQKKLPILQRLIDNGSQSTIKCVASMTSPKVWTTVATGVMPTEHGVLGFTVDDVPVTSTIRKVPAFWNILPQYNILAATVGWMVTWPAETDSGIVISNRAHWGQFPTEIMPPDAIDLDTYRRKWYTDLDDMAKFTTFPYNPEYADLPNDDPTFANNFNFRHRLFDIYVRDTMYVDMAMDVVERHNPEVLAVYLQGIDCTSHGFWKWYEPEPFAAAGWTLPKEEIDVFKDVIPRYYEYTDMLLGKVLDYVGGDPIVIVLSDHGFGPRGSINDPTTGEKVKGERAGWGDFISGNHRDTAVLVVSGPQVRSKVEPVETITHLDILPTMLHALGIKPGEELPGRVLKEFFHEDFQPAAVAKRVEVGKKKKKNHAPVKTEHDEVILEGLRAMGYVK